MNKKVINWREEIINLFPNEAIKELKDNHVWCEKCNGLGIYRSNEKYLSFCHNCRGTGQVELCRNKCGNKQSRGSYLCKQCQEKDWQELQKKKFNNAPKIKFEDYQGKFMDNGIMEEHDFVEEELYMWLKNGYEFEDFRTLYACRKENILNRDLEEYITYYVCDDGYEDMYTYLDFKNFNKVQDAYDNWVKEQGESAYTYWETNTIVDLTDLAKRLVKEIEEENKNVKN